MWTSPPAIRFVTGSPIAAGALQLGSERSLESARVLLGQAKTSSMQSRVTLANRQSRPAQRCRQGR